MKRYIEPSIDVEYALDDELIITTSNEGVIQGRSLGNAYNKDDESYSKDRSNYMHEDMNWDF